MAETIAAERMCLTVDKVTMLEELMTQHGEALFHLCCLYLRDAALAEDAAQEAFLKAYEKWDSLRVEERRKAWLFQIAVNTCKNHLRSGWRNKVELKLSVDFQDEVQSDQEIIRREESRQLLETVSTLRPKYKDVILLYYFQDFSTPEIAEILKIKPDAVRTRLSRAKQMLKNQLEEVDFRD